MMRPMQRVIPEMMERLTAERDLAVARQAQFDPTSPRFHRYTDEIRSHNNQIERVQAFIDLLASQRRAMEDARR